LIQVSLEKSSGQYVITNEDLLDKIVAAAGVRPSDAVLELGSGSGAVTSRLLAVARRVFYSESDAMLSHETLKRAEGEEYTNIEQLKGDALAVPWPSFDVCVSNLPFSMSAPVLFRLIRHRPLWRSAVLIVQREFADALIAEPGERNYSRLSMNASVFVRSERVHRINGACFFPVPPVESAVVRLSPRNPPPQFDFNEFNELTKIAFIEKKRALKTVFSRPFVQKMLETNYKTYCSFHQIPTSHISFPIYLRSALDSTGLQDCPVKQLPPEAMEHVLSVLHASGIYFTSIGSSKRLVSGFSTALEQNIVGASQVESVVQDDKTEYIPVVS
jgi:18S rRNA (adenine1779-N6/adenine1780-N6)-dimethyltransferase